MKYGHGAVWRAGDLIRRYSEALEGCPVTYVHSFAEIREILGDFEIIAIRKEHIFPYVVDRYVRYEYEWLWYFRRMPAWLFRWLEHRMGWHTLVVAKVRS